MTKSGRVLDHESFETLLLWLNPDRELAGEVYEDIRRKLIKIFMRRGCTVAEELADETINRVCYNVQRIIVTYVGDPALYFYGVAQNVYLEYTKKKPIQQPLPQPAPEEEKGEIERNYKCLEKCLEHLEPTSRELILQYFQEVKQAKIDHRKELANRLGITLNTLRMRIYRIKASLQQCVAECLKETDMVGVR